MSNIEKPPIEIDTRQGRLRVTGAPTRVRCGKRTRNAYPCECDCGASVTVREDHLRSGNTTSCGCKDGQGTRTHGAAGTRLYSVWQSMKKRCYTPSSTGYEYCGGRGVTVSTEWRNDFAVFRDWALSGGYAEGMELRRRDLTGDYTPENCEWSTPNDGSRSSSRTRWLVAWGERKPVSQWALDARCYVTDSTLIGRLEKGWSSESAISTPRGGSLSAGDAE